LVAGTGPTPAAEAPAAAAGGSDAPVFDESSLLRLFGGDRKLAATVIGAALEGIPAHFDRLEQALAAQRWQEAAKAAHTAKGLVAQVGGARLAAQLAATESALAAGGRIGAAAVRELRRELALLAEALRSWVR
jgi:HPt (histidine-containing phosphotransfer) domain-containing protein